MTDDQAKEAALIAQYRAASVLRRSASKTTVTAAETALAVKAQRGVFTVRFARDAKPVSELGGVSKALGLSQISIPEFKLRRD